MLEFYTFKNPDGSVLITESKKNKPNAPKRHYIAKDEAKVDDFINQRKNLESMDKFQGAISLLTGVWSGFAAHNKLKSFKVAGGIAAGVGMTIACYAFDYFLDKFLQNRNMKKNDVKEAEICLD